MAKVIIDTTTNTSKVEYWEHIKDPRTLREAGGFTYKVYKEEAKDIEASPVIPYEDQKTIRIANVGLPIHDTATGLTGFNGQVFLVDTGSTRYFCAYIEGTLYKIAIN